MTDYNFRTKGTIKHGIVSFDYDVDVSTDSLQLLEFLNDGFDKLIEEYCRKNNYKREWVR